MTMTSVIVTTALPPRGREEAVLRVAASHHPDVLRIVAGLPMPNFRQPLALHRFLLRRDRTLQQLEDAAALASTMVGPMTKVETDLIRGRLSDYLACGLDPATVLVVAGRSPQRAPVSKAATHDGRVVVAVAEPEAVTSR